MSRIPPLAALGLVLLVTPLAAQRPTYRVELSAGAGLHHFDTQTTLADAFGLAGRLGYWVWGPVSLEGEVAWARPRTKTVLRQRVSTTTFAGWLLLNGRIGDNNSVFVRGGYGNTTYGSCADIAVPGSGPCGNSGVLQGGVGARLGLTRNLLLRSDLTINRSLTTLKFSNLTAQSGLSLMLGSSGRDEDRDGVPDGKDRCPRTAGGTTVDRQGCTLDADRDGVGDRFDRCPETPRGLPVDIAGCPSDGDRDGVPDGLDRCVDTPRDVPVDARGCPAAPAPAPAPAPAARDTLQPGSRSAEPARDSAPPVAKPLPQVTPPAPARDTARAPVVRDTTPRVRDTLPKRRDTTVTRPAPSTPPTARVADRTWVVPGEVWTFRAAILDPAAFPVLDSVAAILKADPTATAEVIGHAYDKLIPADDVRLSQYRAEAVRSYLTFKGVPVSRVTAVGRGSRPLIDRGTSDAAQARNRRVEIRITHPKQ